MSTDAVPAAPCPPSPPPEPDLPEYLAHFPPAAPTRTYASAACSPLSAATANARPEPTAPAQCNGPSQEEIRSFVFDTLFANEWDSDLRVRKISLTADAPSFKFKVPRTSRAGVNETLTGEQIAARLVKVMRSRAQPGATMDAWRKDQIAWLLQPTRPTLGFTGARTAYSRTASTARPSRLPRARPGSHRPDDQAGTLSKFHGAPTFIRDRGPPSGGTTLHRRCSRLPKPWTLAWCPPLSS